MIMRTSMLGFTLLETAIALLIVALLMGGLLPALSSRIEQRQVLEVHQQLAKIEESLIGFAIANGRLPCPASDISNSQESFATGGSATDGNCSNNYDGYVPVAALGLPTGTNGMLDPWGNRIHYAVTAWNSHTYTRTNGMRNAGINSLSPNLLVCATALGSDASSCASGMALTADPGVPAVIYSLGKNGGHSDSGNDEAANPNSSISDNNRVFVSHEPTVATSSGGEFDDIMIWLSPHILMNRMVAAGVLP